MLSKKQILYDGAFKFTSVSTDVSVEDFAIRILEEMGGFDPLDASEYVVKFIKRITNDLGIQNDELSRRGITPIGIISGKRISWTSPNPMHRKVWLLRPIFLEIIDRLPDEQFEAICCLCVDIIGGKVWRTKNKGDGNVDLYGIVQGMVGNHLFGAANKLKIVGQCKNYDHSENVTNFDSHLQAMHNVRHLANRVLSNIPNEFIRESGPLCGWYICKGGFQSGVYEEARKHGVILSDKYDIVEILTQLELKGIASTRTRCFTNLYRELKRFL